MPDTSRRLIEELQRQAAEATAKVDAEMAASRARLEADLARARAHADNARADYEAVVRAEIDRLRARGIPDPEQFYRDAHARGRELAAPEWERLERELLPRRDDAKARLSGTDLDREMQIIDAEIDARVQIRAAQIARDILARGAL